MKIHYISCHSILEYDEVKLFTELGHEVYSNGAYRDPRGSYTLPRPGIPNAPFSEEFFNQTAIHPKTDLPPEMIDPYDVIIIMHSPEVLFNNWQKIKHKRVIWRTIGQSVPHIEKQVQEMKAEGLEIVRYSVMERNIENYAGEDAMIYFYKDPEEFNDWNGEDLRPINFTQSLLGRRHFVHYDEIYQVLQGYPTSKVYGTGNDDLGALNGGEMPFEMLKKYMRDARCYIYAGTFPASYTLSIMEAMMTGIPVIAIGAKIAQESTYYPKIDFYEIPSIIKNGVNGFVSDSINDMRSYVDMLLANETLAQNISKAGRETAIEFWGKEKIANQWKSFLDK